MEYDGPIAMSDRKPSLCLNDKDLPGLKDAKIGQTMTLTLEVKVRDLSARRNDTADGKNGVHGDFEVTSIKQGGE